VWSSKGEVEEELLMRIMIKNAEEVMSKDQYTTHDSQTKIIKQKKKNDQKVEEELLSMYSEDLQRQNTPTRGEECSTLANETLMQVAASFK
jgi:hypothetical protein